MNKHTFHLSTAIGMLGVSLVCFAAGAAQAQSTAPAAPMTITDKSAVGELAYWNAIKESQDPEMFRAYLDNFPNGMFADPAMTRYQELAGKPYVAGATPPAGGPPDGRAVAGRPPSRTTARPRTGSLRVRPPRGRG